MLLNVYRQSDSNTIKVADAMHAEIESLRKSLPPGVELQPFYDQSEIVGDSIKSVRDAIVVGLVLVSVIMLVFLHDWGTSIVAGLVIPVAEIVLGKQRILEIYLNVVEWGPGIYGAESACRYYDGTAARNVGRQQAVQLAAILPAPLKRRPERMNNYSGLILKRMRQMGW